MNLMDLSGKKALVIGAGGIGTALAVGFAQHGADVAVADRDAGKAETAASEVRAFGCRTLARARRRHRRGVGRALWPPIWSASWGGIDILVNTAGVAARTPSVSVPIEKVRETLEVNTLGTFICCRVFGKEMMERGRRQDRQHLVGEGAATAPAAAWSTTAPARAPSTR